MSAYLNSLIRRRDLQDKTILLSTHGAATCAMLNAIDPPEGFFWRGGVPYNCSYAIVDVIDGEPGWWRKTRSVTPRHNRANAMP